MLLLLVLRARLEKLLCVGSGSRNLQIVVVVAVAAAAAAVYSDTLK